MKIEFNAGLFQTTLLELSLSEALEILYGLRSQRTKYYLIQESAPDNDRIRRIIGMLDKMIGQIEEVLDL